MRRVHLRGSDNVSKRVLVHAAAFNIGLLLRKLSGWGKPRAASGCRNSGLWEPTLLSSLVEITAPAVERFRKLRLQDLPGFSPANVLFAAA